MEHIQARILKEEDMEFVINRAYTLYFDVNKRSFRLHFCDERPFYLDFLTLKELFSRIKSTYRQNWISKTEDITIYNTRNGEDIGTLQVDFFWNHVSTGGLDYISLEMMPGSKSLTGEDRCGERFFIIGRGAILDLLKLQSEILTFMKEYEKFQNFKLSKLTLSDQLLVCVEGNISGGIGSLNSFFQRDPEVFVCPETNDELRDEFGIITLKKLSEYPAKNSLFFQLCHLINMHKRCQKIKINDLRQKLIIMENCSLTAKHFFIPVFHVRGYIDNIQESILMKLDKMVDGDKLLPDVVIYVKNNPERVLERMNTSNGNEERYFTIRDFKYFDDEYEMYLRLLKYFYKIPVFIIDGNKSLKDINSEFQKLKPIMLSLLKKKLEREEETRNLKKEEETRNLEKEEETRNLKKEEEIRNSKKEEDD
nr:MAG: deoxynucleoside kinase-like protein [Porcellio scaber clopovirus]